MDTTDIVLAVIDREGGRFIGKTLLQKKIYFLNELINLGVEFTPHYYGPYSREVALAIDALVELHFLESLEEHFPSQKGLWGEVKRYTYKLTEEGRQLLKSSKYDDQHKALVKHLDRINSSSVAKDYDKLSRAAKVFCIVKRKGEVTLAKIKDEAEELGWDLSQEDIKGVQSFLFDAGFVEVT